LVVTPGGGASTMFVAFKAWLSHLTNPTVGAWLVVAAYIGSMCLLARALHARGWFIRA
jgi:hypothetical protein